MFTLPFAIFFIYQPAPSFQDQATFNMRQIVIPSDDRIDDSFVIQDNLVCNLERLENIAELKTNWNGYGAEPFSVALVEEVKDIILNLNEQPEIFPTGRNSIQLEYHLRDESYLEFEVFEDKVIAMQVSGTDYDNAQFWEFASDDIAQIRDITDKFLNA